MNCLPLQIRVRQDHRFYYYCANIWICTYFSECWTHT